MGNGVTRKAAKNGGASSSYRIPSRIVLPVRRTVLFVPREADTVVGKQGKACLATLMDRKSRYLLGGKATSKTAAADMRSILKGVILSLKIHHST